MQIRLYIGLDTMVATRMQRVLADKRNQMLAKGILLPETVTGAALAMAVTDPDRITAQQSEQGYGEPGKQHSLRATLAADLARDIAQHQPEMLILCASELGQALSRPAELQRLKELLSPLSTDIRIVAHVEEQARMLARHHAAQVMNGRATSLSDEIALTRAGDWWNKSLAGAPKGDAQTGLFPETQAAPFWMDYAALVDFWDATFGPGSLSLRGIDLDAFATETMTNEIRACFGIAPTLGKATPDPFPPAIAAPWLSRARRLNVLFLQIVASGQRVIPADLWRTLLAEIEIGGDPIAPGKLAAVSDYFRADNQTLIKAHSGLKGSHLRPDPAQKGWQECDPGNGFRASQYLLAFMYRIDKASRAHRKPDKSKTDGRKSEKTTPTPSGIGLTQAARALMPPLAVQNFDNLRKTPYAPHNRLGSINETEPAEAYAPMSPRIVPDGSSGRVIVGCMKDEAPYIVEWVAYHRAIGVDNFLIYTNDCSDGTAEILTSLQEMGVLQHRDNSTWKGKSPQQHALNMSLEEPLIRNAEWIIHIDVDEFMNVRTGNGTLDDFFAKVPDATNVAMTWRLFGHNGVTRLADDFVVDQFDTCAPSYCPKPHTAWGFKTMFKNIGAYGKISCHRPNKLEEDLRDQVRWVNGSGQDMTEEAINNGWRNSRKSIGYDLLQLNHYALRSTESFLIKRQRGRALHVNRSIGINYWIRMDWSGFRDVTIKRNIPRLRAEYDRLMQDETLRKWHQNGLDWHRAKAQELHDIPEFQELYDTALTIKLNETERAAYAMALDMES